MQVFVILNAGFEHHDCGGTSKFYSSVGAIKESSSINRSNDSLVQPPSVWRGEKHVIPKDD